MTTFDTGRKAEAAGVQFLKKQGYEIVEQNWRTRQCEIDVVARKDGTMYFVEVKYRQNVNQGSGLEYITPKKLQQMHFAAETWTHEHEWSGDYQLAAIEVSGTNFDITEFLDDIIL